MNERTPRCGAMVVAHAGVKAELADEVAGAQRDPAKLQAGVNRVVEPRQLADRLGHQVAGVEREHDLVVALDAELLRQQLAVAGRVLPVDEAVVHARRVVAQRIEFGALAFLAARPSCHGPPRAR